MVALSWVVKTESGGRKKHVISPQLSKDSATEFKFPVFVSVFLNFIS